MKHNIVLLSILLCLVSCKDTSKENLIKVEDDLLVEWVKSGTFPKSKSMVVVDSMGKRIPIGSLSKVSNHRDFKRVFYMDA